MEDGISSIGIQKQAGVVVLIWRKRFKAKIRRDRKVHYMLLKGTIHQKTQ
jgi:hypothetical protein